MLLRQVTSACGRRGLAGLATTTLRQQQEKDIQDLHDFLPKVIGQLTERSKRCNIPSETEWYSKLLNYTVRGGKMVRALSTYNGMRALAPQGGLTDKYLDEAKTLAWSVEIIQASLLVIDDLVDEAPVRRGKPAWGKVAGPAAILDANLLTVSAFALVEDNQPSDAFARVAAVYLNTLFEFYIGENHDTRSQVKGNVKFEEFSHKRHRDSAIYKTGVYTFYLPTAAAIAARNYGDEKTYSVAHELGADIGHLYQVQDDFLDCYGAIKVMGKERTDIRNGKCTWLICEALLRADSKQLAILKENYGKADPAKTAAVTAVYDELNLKEAFYEYQDKLFDDITGKIKKYSHVLPPDVFTYVLETIKHHIER